MLFLTSIFPARRFALPVLGSIVIYRTIVLGQAASRPSASHAAEEYAVKIWIMIGIAAGRTSRSVAALDEQSMAFLAERFGSYPKALRAWI
jgi:nucleoside phosphorylase